MFSKNNNNCRISNPNINVGISSIMMHRAKETAAWYP